MTNRDRMAKRAMEKRERKRERERERGRKEGEEQQVGERLTKMMLSRHRTSRNRRYGRMQERWRQCDSVFTTEYLKRYIKSEL